MAFYVVDSQPKKPFQSRLTDLGGAIAWLNRMDWQSCITDENVKRHVTEICPANKKALLDQTHASLAALAPGDEALLIRRDDSEPNDIREPGHSPKRVELWAYLLLSAAQENKPRTRRG